MEMIDARQTFLRRVIRHRRKSGDFWVDIRQVGV